MSYLKRIIQPLATPWLRKLYQRFGPQTPCLATPHLFQLCHWPYLIPFTRIPRPRPPKGDLSITSATLPATTAFAPAYSPHRTDSAYHLYSSRPPRYP